MSQKVKPKNLAELKQIIEDTIQKEGEKCNLNFIDVSSITDFNHLFEFSDFNGNISEWDVSNATDMSYMFYHSQFNGNISNWNVSNTTDMRFMFFSSQFNGDISKWDVSKVTNMHGTFYGSQFNGDISKWNVSNVTNMNSMFRHSPFDGDISDWDVSNVTNMSYMFNESHFDGDISKWDMSNVSNNEGMFDNSQFSGDISNLNISNNNSDSDEDECVCAFANEDDDADECVCAFANEDDDADSFSGNLHDCVVSSVNILLFRKQQNEGITCCSAIKKEDELAQKFIKHMGNDFSLVNELYGFKEGSFAYENVISFDGEDSKALAEADNYSEDTLESTVFYKIKDFCDDNDVVAFVSVLMNGLNCGVFSYKTVAAFISPDDLCYSSSSIYPEASEELIQRIMEKEGCDELEANEKALDSGEGFREAIESIYDDINDSFVGEHVACFEDNGINDISEISNDKEIMDEMKERSETGTVFVFENEYPWVALILSNVNDK